MKASSHRIRFKIKNITIDTTVSLVDKAELDQVESGLKTLAYEILDMSKTQKEAAYRDLLVRTGEKGYKKTTQDLVRKKFLGDITVNTLLVKDIWKIYYNEFYVTGKGKNSEARTYEQEQSKVEDFIFYCHDHGVYDVASITKALATDYLEDYKANGAYSIVSYKSKVRKRNKSIDQPSIPTLNKKLSTLKCVFRVLHEKDGMIKNTFHPFGAWEEIKRARRDKRGAFSKAELAIIDTNLHKAPEHVKYIYMVGRYTGLRLVDMAFLREDERFTHEGTDYLNLITRKVDEEVFIPINTKLRDYLDSLTIVDGYYSHDCFKYHGAGEKVSSKLSTDFKSFLDSIGIKTEIRVKGRKNAVPIRSIHSLRHTFVTQLDEKGAALTDIRDAVGHSGIEMTLHYVAKGTTDKLKRSLTFMEML